jgi:transglutaminase-like putative cysteine protease
MTLASWVAINIATTAEGTGIRPAGTVLAERAGDAEEKAMLLVAMARRVGLPARLAGGVLLTPRGLRTHTWAELFIGDWVPFDPSQSSSVASSTHLRLVSGSSGRWTELFPLAGGLVATGRDLVELP